MRLTKTNIAKFQQIYFECFGVEISMDEAIKQGLKLVTLVKTIGPELNNEPKLYE